MNLIYTSIYTYTYALLYALMEIEIEGQHGWAKKLPTFTIKKGIFKNFTFYHILMNLIVILTNSFPILHNYELTLNGILYSVYFNTLWFLIEDFLWFVLNPYYTIKKYNKDISWHSKQYWILGIPSHNYFGLSILLGIIYYTNNKLLLNILVLLFMFTIFIIKISPIYHYIYLKYHNS